MSPRRNENAERPPAQTNRSYGKRGRRKGAEGKPTRSDRAKPPPENIERRSV